MRRYLLIMHLLLAPFLLSNLHASDGVRIRVKTTMGDLTILLYDDTPQHRDNYLKLIDEGYLKGKLFHRLVKDFIVQAGDPDRRWQDSTDVRLYCTLDYTIPAEIRLPHCYHKRGALGAGRDPMAGASNASSPSQFYIVWGEIFDEETLDKADVRIAKNTDNTFVLNDTMREVYRTCGGWPYLDGDYTIFGEVLEGLEIIEKMHQLPVDKEKGKRPLADIVIIDICRIEE